VKVASQNFRPDAGDTPRFARQHRVFARKDPEIELKAAARASPEVSQKPSLIRRFCPFEKCSPNTFLSAAQPCADLASSITLRFDRLRFSRRPLSRKAMTQSA
jgi:hypothetical protein